MFIVLGIYNLGIIFAAVEKLVRPPSPPRHEIVTTMGKVANIRHCVATGHWLSHWSQIFYKIATFELPEKRNNNFSPVNSFDIESFFSLADFHTSMKMASA